MKNFISKHLQQTVLLALAIVIVAGVAFAASTPFSTGFIRSVWDGENDFFYGYGMSSISDTSTTYGYGYGYEAGYRDNNLSPVDYAEYGFVGTDGSATIDNVAVTQTTATIDYSTGYLAKVAYGYSEENPPTQFNAIDYQDESSFNSGSRTISITNLTCATTYYYLISAKDAGNHRWPIYSSFTTSACDTVSGTTTVVTTVTSTGSHGASQPFGGVPSTTPNGDRPSFPESPRLEYSDFGPGPKLLQKLLNHLGYTVSVYGAGSPGSETEFFGPKTRAALKKFQKAHGLNPDGIYGLITKAALEREVNR